MKKKYIYIIVILSVALSVAVWYFWKTSFDIKGEILLNMQNDKKGMVLYNCETGESRQIVKYGTESKFFKDHTILLGGFDEITEFDLNTQEETVIYEGEPFESFSICNDKNLSVSEDNIIYLYDIETKEKTVLVQDNDFGIHSWSKDGEVLYYRSLQGIKSVNISSGETKEIADGNDPIVFESKIAYRKNDQLIVKDMKTNKQYTYNDHAKSYCFSPTGKEILIEANLNLLDGFKTGRIGGSKLVVWKYDTNQQKTIIDYCQTEYEAVCDWR